MDIVFEKERGRIVSFSVNYRARFGDEWHEVIRYDTHHGRLHVHRFWRTERRQIEFLEPAQDSPRDYAQALRDAQGDVKRRWRHYRSLLGRRR